MHISQSGQYHKLLIIILHLYLYLYSDEGYIPSNFVKSVVMDRT